MIRDGEEWSSRRRILNKFFLMPEVISQYTSVFNDVITDMLANWSTKLAATGRKEQLVINDLEKQLYMWSVECKFISCLNNT